MKSITIIGYGWLGRACADYLHAKNYTVKVTNRTAAIKDLNYPIFSWQLGNPFPKEAISEIIVLCIAEKENNFSNYIKLYKDLELGGVKQIIFISSSSIYNALEGNVTENAEIILNDANVNVASKELTLKETSIPNTILRLAGLVGPGRNPSTFLAGKKNVPNPNNKINLVHQQDVIFFIQKCIENETLGIYNVCSSMHPTREEFYTNVCKVQGLEIPSFAKDTEAIRWVDNAKSKKDLAFEYQYDNLMEFYAKSETKA